MPPFEGLVGDAVEVGRTGVQGLILGAGEPAMNTSNGIDSVLAQMRATAAQAAPRQAAGQAPSGAGFADALQEALRDVSAQQARGDDLKRRLDTDPNVALQDVVVELSKASLSFQMMVQVRERLVAAYREVMNMQI